MIVALAYDHRGREVAGYIMGVIERLGHACMDLGFKEDGVADCPDFAYTAAKAVADGHADTAVLLCNTGIGMSVSANKVKGIRAALCNDEMIARQAREQIDANVLCLSGDLLGKRLSGKITETWLAAEYSQSDRSKRIVEKISAIEEDQVSRLDVQAGVYSA